MVNIANYSIKKQKAEEIAENALPAKTNNAVESAGDEEYMADTLIRKVFENIICDSHF